MSNYSKIIMGVEAALIVVLLMLCIYYYQKAVSVEAIGPPRDLRLNGLLSQRVYTHVLKPQSYLIVNFEPFENQLRSTIEQRGLNVSAYIENLRGGAHMGINEEAAFPLFSLSKLPLAIVMLRKVEAGQLSLDTPIPISIEDKSSNYGSLYKTNETVLPLKELLEVMLQESDNTATNTLLHYVTSDDLNFLLSYYSLDPDLYYPLLTLSGSDGHQETTPEEIANIFKSLFLSTVLEPEHSEYILSLLTKTVFDLNKFADLPEDVIVSHKFGINYINNHEMFHDCGIMYIEESRFFYCIMTKDLKREQAVVVVSDIVHGLYAYVIDSKGFLDNTYRNVSMKKNNSS